MKTYITEFKSRSYGEHLLRAGVAFAFLYPPISAIAEPNVWIDYIPAWAGVLGLEDIVLLHIFGAIEAILGIWILFGRKTVIPASVAGVILLYITFAYPGQFPVLFRDLALALAAFALAYQNHEKITRT